MSAPVSLLDGYQAHAIHRGAHHTLTDDVGTYTFGELWSAASAFSKRLERLRLPAHTPVAVAMDGTAANIGALLGVMLAGAAAAPLNIALTDAEQAQYLDLLNPAVVVADAGSAERIRGVAELLEVDTDRHAVRLDERLGVPGGTPGRAGFLAMTADAPALLVPTGGTTGLPKAAVLTHHATLVWALSMAGHGRAGAGVELFFLPFFHVGLVTGVLSTLHAGAPAILQRRFDPERACDAIVHDGATRVQVVPTHLRKLQQAANFDEARHLVRHVRFGGMASVPELVDELLDDLPNAHLSTGYGATEFGPVTLVDHDDLLAGRRTGVGRPLPGVRISIVSEAGAPAEPGQVGHVVVRCPWQASGYVGRPGETELAFTDRGVRLADCGSFDDEGWLTLAGRHSDMVITGGENVFPAEIEAVLARHPDVVEVVVVGMPDAVWGERVEAAIVPRPGAFTTDDLRTFARDQLAPYKLPRSVRMLDRMPLTPNNKPDRRALRAGAGAPADAV